MPGLLSIGLDLLILCLLGGTIFYAWKLSHALNKFKNHRQEMNALITDLNRSVKASETAIKNLRDTGLQASSQLQEKISDAHQMHNDLKLMNDLADNLSRRLERKMERQPAPEKTVEVSGNKETKIPRSKTKSKQDMDEIPSFFIQDRDMDQNNIQESDMTGDSSDDNMNIPSNLQSEAEKELFKALQKNKQTRH